MVPVGDLAGVRNFTEQSPQEGGFAGTIGADQECQFTAMEMEIHSVQDFDRAKTGRQALNPGATGIARGCEQGVR
jgi:hypothetical protein